ncbi:uncharacterized protein VTP21DRAFT_352 [Calcarisporiella thermophila]|uniref:uncharacterized protein n=1 Tax=Calcarisporiella thermophila TaxID=911321 RepID=UPI0037420584
MDSPKVKKMTEQNEAANTTVKKSQKDMTKAERRALQEKQRAEKAARKAATAQQPVGQKSAAIKPPTKPGASSEQAKPTKAKTASVKQEDETEVSLFSHLEIPKGPNTSNLAEDLHPAVVSLGLQFAQFKICGSNARCIATLTAFKKLIQDYRTPPHTTLSRHLPTYLSPQIAYLVQCRSMSTSMGNAIRQLKYEISILDIDMPDEDAKTHLIEKIDLFIRDRITMADTLIVQIGMQKIQNGDVIMTYGRSSVVQALLLSAKKKGLNFRVIVVDSKPRFEGKQLLRQLCDADIKCTYVQLNAVSFVMPEVTKIFLGAHSLLSNGSLYARVGTAMVAMAAHDQRIPVIVLCETYKFTDRVQLDSIVTNELAHPEELIPEEDAQLTREIKNLNFINLMYDVTPSKYVTAVITELGIVPCTSVPVVLREYKPMLQ